MSSSYAHQHSSGSHVVLAHSRVGSPVASPEGIEAGGNIRKAGLLSSAPYKPPKRRKRDSPAKVLCASEGCKAYPMKIFPYCTGHARSLGLVEFGGGKGLKVIADGDAD